MRDEPTPQAKKEKEDKVIFCKYLYQYMALLGKIEVVNKAMQGLSHDFGGMYIDDLDIVPRMLTDWFEDRNENESWTSWWLYECDAGKKSMEATVNGKNFTPRTPEELFDLITEWNNA